MPRSKHSKFGRETKQRKALMKSLATALILHGRITTTQAKAKALRPHIEKLITTGKTPSLATTKLLTSQLSLLSAQKIIKEIAPKFMQRPGGYTRIRNLPQRISDGASVAIIEFVS